MLLQILRRDGGPIYAETNLSHLIVEPYNAISAILFLVVVVYWWSKLRGKYEQHTFLSYVIPILGIGGVGGTLYHAFRYTSIFHYMDWLPILFLCMAGSFYFCYKFFEGRNSSGGGNLTSFGHLQLASAHSREYFLFTIGYTNAGSYLVGHATTKFCE